MTDAAWTAQAREIGEQPEEKVPDFVVMAGRQLAKVEHALDLAEAAGEMARAEIIAARNDLADRYTELGRIQYIADEWDGEEDEDEEDYKG